VEESGKLEDLVPLGALLADLGETEAADDAYHRALGCYSDVSPFALAWVCFQLAVLWGETTADPDPERAALWYRRALGYLPAHAKARIHLAEILAGRRRFAEAEELLAAIRDTGDPEVHWRLAEVCAATGDPREAERELERAGAIYRELLEKHPLAYADHGAEFYLTGGNDPVRALGLARLNLDNRPTPRAFALAIEAANAARDRAAVSEISEAWKNHWGATAAFRNPPLREQSEGSEDRHADSP
jgi:tetratricopeptide (TPR) repeat protein